MIEEVIAERQFHLESGEPLIVRWMKPVPIEGNWSCLVELAWPNEPVRRKATQGVDSAQALFLAMQRTVTDLYTHEPQIYWFEPNDDLGLPTTTSIDDLRLARHAGT